MVTYIPTPFGTFIPSQASFPVPPPVPRLPVTDEEGFFTPVYMDFIQKLWAALQGQGGLYEITYSEILGFGNDLAKAQEMASDLVTLTSSITDGLEARLSNAEREIDGVKLVALMAGGATASTTEANMCLPVVRSPITLTIDSSYECGTVFTNQA